MTGIILIAAGMIFLIIGILFVLQTNKNQEVEVMYVIQPSENETSNLKKEVKAKHVTQPKKKETSNLKKEVKKNDENEKKGYDFEKFVVKKFNKRYFSIKKWRGDKYVEGRYAEDTPAPDLLLELKLRDTSYQFAVECKWQSKYYKGGFELSEKDFEKYKQYEEKNNIPVFIVVGIGGTAANPENLYIIKLSSVKYNFFKKDFLSKFEKKDKTAEFYFDSKTTELR